MVELHHVWRISQAAIRAGGVLGPVDDLSYFGSVSQVVQSLVEGHYSIARNDAAIPAFTAGMVWSIMLL